MSNLKLRVSKLSDNDLINVLNCREQLRKGLKINPLAKWRKILIDTLVHKIENNEIDEIELLIIEQGN
jgi:hypothetical protein